MSAPLTIPSGWQADGPGVFRARISPLAVGSAEIEFLESQLPASRLGRVRLCAHWNDNETLQEMIIAMDRNSYVRPHRHAAKSEAFHMIAGEMDVVIFDEQGAIAHVIPLGRGSERSFYYRLAAGSFHSLVIHSPSVIFQEITTGPFRKEQTEYAHWSPDESDAPRVVAFQQRLRESVAHWHPAGVLATA